MADHIHFTEIRKVRAAGGETLSERGEFHIAHGKGKPSPPGLAFLPEKWLIEDKPCRT
jgi:hypothetical protein